MEPLIRYHSLVNQLSDIEYTSFICKLIQKFGRNIMDSFIFRQFTPCPMNTKPKKRAIYRAVRTASAQCNTRSYKADKKTELKKISNACIDTVTSIFNQQRTDIFTINDCIEIIQQVINARDIDLDIQTSLNNYNNYNNHNIDLLPKDCAGKIASFLDCTSYHNLQLVNTKLFLLTNSPITLQSLRISNKEHANSYRISKYPNIKEISFNLELFNPLVSKLITNNTNYTFDAHGNATYASSSTKKEENLNVLCKCQPIKLTLFSEEAPIDGIYHFVWTGYSMFDFSQLQTLSLNGAMAGDNYLDKLLIKINAMSSDKLQYLYIYTQNIRIDNSYRLNFNKKNKQNNVSLFPSLKGLFIDTPFHFEMFSKFIPMFANQLEAFCIVDDKSIPTEFDFANLQLPKLKELRLKLLSSTKHVQKQIEYIINACATQHLKRICIDVQNIKNAIDISRIWKMLSAIQFLQCIEIKMDSDNKLDEAMDIIERCLLNGKIGNVRTLSISLQTRNIGGDPTTHTLDILIKIITAIPSSIKDFVITLIVCPTKRYNRNTKWIEKYLQVLNNVNCKVSAQHFRHKMVITNNDNKMMDLQEIWMMNKTNDNQLLPKRWR